MGRSRKRCIDCGRLAVDGWHISKEQRCRLCARERAARVVDAGFPPDPESGGVVGRYPDGMVWTVQPNRPLEATTTP